MTQLTTLTREQIRDVLVGLADSAQPEARIRGIGAMADALTTTRPVDPELAALRLRLVHALVDDEATATDPDTVDDAIMAALIEQGVEGSKWRDRLAALLDMDPWSTDEAIIETAAARAAQRAQERAATKTQALVAGDELQQALAVLASRRALDAVELQALQVVRQRLEELTASRQAQTEIHRDTLTSLLGLDPSISDEDLADTVTEAIALRRAAS